VPTISWIHGSPRTTWPSSSSPLDSLCKFRRTCKHLTSEYSKRLLVSCLAQAPASCRAPGFASHNITNSRKNYGTDSFVSRIAQPIPPACRTISSLQTSEFRLSPSYCLIRDLAKLHQRTRRATSAQRRYCRRATAADRQCRS
jgi:hypothetical protein